MCVCAVVCPCAHMSVGTCSLRPRAIEPSGPLYALMTRSPLRKRGLASMNKTWLCRVKQIALLFSNGFVEVLLNPSPLPAASPARACRPSCPHASGPAASLRADKPACLIINIRVDMTSNVLCCINSMIIIITIIINFIITTIITIATIVTIIRFNIMIIACLVCAATGLRGLRAGVARLPAFSGGGLFVVRLLYLFNRTSIYYEIL